MKASDYRKLIQQTAQNTVTELEMPSGAVFKVREPNLDVYIASGELPVSLLAKFKEAAGMTEAGKAGSPDVNEAILRSFTTEDFTRQQALTRRLIETSVVEPRIAFLGDAVTAEDDDFIYASDIPAEDFTYLMKWLWSGGKAGEQLAKFSRKPKRKG